MDYKYIEQLVERYFECQTTLKEEEILRAFFSQEDVPARLLRYKALFSYEQNSLNEEVLGDDFDAKILSMIEEEPETVKAKTISFSQRLIPLFKAAAIVAIILTLGNAAQMPYQENQVNSTNMADINKGVVKEEGPSVAMSDSLATDSLRSVSTSIIK